MTDSKPPEEAAKPAPAPAAEADSAQKGAPQTPPPAQPRRLRGGLLSSLCGTVLTVVLIVGVAVLVLWLVFRPHKPRFYVQSAAIYQLNVSDGSVSTNMQFTVICANPNGRVGIYFDSLSAFVSYREEIITLVTPLPPFYEGHKTIVVLSPFLAGYSVPAPPDISMALSADESYGLVEMSLHMEGHIRWKVGVFRTGHYHLDVRCDILVGVKQSIGAQVPLLRGQRCGVDV